MRNFILILFIFFINKLYASNYYFSNALGNDSRTYIEAQNPASPWKTLEKLKAHLPFLHPGDSVLFSRGDTFEGSIAIVNSGTKDNPVVFAAYGIGNKPVISGFTLLNAWTAGSNGIFESYSPALLTTVNTVLINGKPQAIGRFPNANTINKGYLNYEASTGSTQITDNQLAASPNWTNAEVVIRKNRWVVDRNLVTLHSGTTIKYLTGSHYSADVNFGYFFQNDPKTLDQQGEWYFNATGKKIGIFFGLNSPVLSVVKASCVSTIISIVSKQYIVFNGISFEGANDNAFDISKSGQVTIINCDVSFSGANAIIASGTSGLTVENTNIRYTNNNALTLTGCSNTIIRNNKITCTGTIPGMGKGDAGSYEAVLIEGDNNLIELNTIDSTGYIPVTFNGNAVVIRNNFITNYAFVKDDGGGIYTYNGSSSPKINSDRKITGNILLNGKGAGEGTANPANLYANGIYMDDKVNNVEITGNTVANCAQYGLFVHNANKVIIKKNTLYNNGGQLAMVHDKIAPDNPVRNISLVNNIMFSKSPGSYTAAYKTFNNDLKDFGSFDSNYYCRPLNDNLSINSAYVSGAVNYNEATDLEEWKFITAREKASKKSPVKIAPYKINKLMGSNKFSNGNFNATISGLYAWSAAGNSKAAWVSNALDGGSLAISYSKMTGTTNRTSVIIAAGQLIAQKKYVLKFSLKGTDSYKSLEVFLRKSLADYSDLSARENVLIKSSRTENEIVFTASATESNASIVFNVEEQPSPLYFDNVQLYEADAASINADENIRFEYNAAATVKNISLDGSYVDVANKTYTGSVTLAPFTSVILLKPGSDDVAHDTTVAPVPTLCGASGYIMNERWNNAEGNNVRDIPLTRSPDEIIQLTTPEINNAGQKYGTRIRGYICAPETGNYIFFISGDDAAELWLSPGSDEQNKVKIASFLSWTNFRQWDKFPSQQSPVISLIKDNRYYIEILHKQGGGGDNLSVAWQLPGGTLEAPIAGSRLSPYTMSYTFAGRN